MIKPSVTRSVKEYLKEFLIEVLERALESSPAFRECVETAQRRRDGYNPFDVLKGAEGSERASRLTILPPPRTHKKSILN